MKVILDMLTKTSVSVKVIETVEKDGKAYEVGQPHRRAYVNSTRGREEIQAELQEPYLGAVLAVWGDEPTVKEELEESHP